MFEIDFYSTSEAAIIELAQQKLLTVDEHWEQQVWQFIVDWFNPSIPAIAVFTSGSTGPPKQIEHTKAAMIFSAQQTCTALSLKHGNRALLCLPVNKISGMMMVVRSIYNKMKLVCIKPSTTPLTEIPENADIDFAAFTPMQFHGITRSYPVFLKAEKIKKIILGGEDVRAELVQNIQKLENEIYITFGMTETISHIALKRLNGPSPDKNFKVLPGIHIAAGENGCLIIEAPQLGQPRLVTNDVVSVEGENEFQWLGRVDNVINTGGIKIYPEEIEQQLVNTIEAPYFITSQKDITGGEKLILVLEMILLKPEEKEELREAFSKLEKRHRPKQVILIPHFARTSNGKIKRRESFLNPIDIIDFS
jgi:O-succinylbenzoic acid--CoA ligase